MIHCTNREKHSKPLVYQSSQVYQNCTNSVTVVYQSSKTVKQQKMTIGVPVVTCRHRVRRIHKAVCAYQQCCHLANGNKTCPSLLVFKNNNMAHESRGFVGQSSRNSGTHAEQPSMLNKFFFQNYNILPRSGRRDSRKFAGGV